MNLFKTAARTSIKNTHRLPHLKQKKNPAVAFALGVAFGFFGVGFYVSWLDAMIVLAVFLIGTFATMGVAAPVLWLFFGCYAAVRVSHSNRALDEQAGTTTALRRDKGDAHEIDASSNGAISDPGYLRRGVSVRR